jgi:hypothetical protein
VANLTSKRALDAARSLTISLAGLIVSAIACVPPLPGSPYESPDDRAGAGGGQAGSVGAGGSTGQTGGGGITGPGISGAAGTPACGLPLIVQLSPPEITPMPVGSSASFDVLVANQDAPACPSRPPPHLGCSAMSALVRVFPDSNHWFTTPLFPGVPQHGLVQVSLSQSAPAGHYDFTCSTGIPGESATATCVVAGGPSVAGACEGVPPPTPVVLGGFPSWPYVFAAAGLNPPSVVRIGADGQPLAVQVTASPGIATDPSQAWSGFGFNFQAPPCLDARAFSGVRFTVSGDLGTCGLQFSVVTSEDASPTHNPLGACPAEPCYPPTLGPVSIGPTTVSFEDLSGGMPMSTVDRAVLLGIQWTLDLPTDAAIPACIASFTVSDISFVP